MTVAMNRGADLSAMLRSQAQDEYLKLILRYRLRQVLILGDLPEPHYRDWAEYVEGSQEWLAVQQLVLELGRGIQRHHIVPRCAWREQRGINVDSPLNIVWVNNDEHFDLHRKLATCYVGTEEQKPLLQTVLHWHSFRPRSQVSENPKRLARSKRKRR